ncbi:hypothetical protein R1sor_006599 [Riccia sorocarpa]|uniref:Enoyl reductase (ER) domain-containing protein n=1 Tax=Riccia sorocarpa TaxID=122646 RepID=A0ABD3HNE7_9MARC
MTEGKECYGWAARDSSGVLEPFTFTRRPTGPNDVTFRVTHCGMCHAELIFCLDKNGHFPMVPGHEVAGVVTEVGSNVTKFKIGDHVGVGTFVRSCLNCETCKDDMQQVCSKVVWTYNGVDWDGTVTAGGYSNCMVVDQEHVLSIPEGMPLAEAAPLLCAGITVYSPMMRHGMNKAGQTLGVVGLGGLGHLAVKFGKAFGMKVTVLSTSESKKEEALTVLGADAFVNTSDPAQLEAARMTIHNIVDTVPVHHPLDVYLPLLKLKGTIVLVGFPHEPLQFTAYNLHPGLRSISGSVTGSIAETQEMLEFCAKNNVLPIIETVDIKDCNENLKRMKEKDVRYRFVIDVEHTLTRT